MLRLFTCSCGPVLGDGEAVPLGHDDGSDAQHTHDGQVDETRLGRAVEGVIQPGDEAAHDQKSDARVIQPAEEGEQHTLHSGGS